MGNKFASYWDNKHLTKYAGSDWIGKPSLFATWVVKYLPGSGSLLDLGAGQGQDSRYFAELGYDVTSTDFSDEALELSRQAAEKADLPIKLIDQDLRQPLNFPDASFDVVYAHLSLHYFDDATTKQLFSEIHRILKPGGILAAITNSTADPELESGKPLEPGFVEHEGVHKRYFNPETIQNYTTGFETIVADNEGTTHKDPIKLIRYVGKKN